MKNITVSSIPLIVVTALLFSLVSCDRDSIATESVTADKKAVGHWHLVSITSGWTGKTDSPTEKIEMNINAQQQATVSKNGTEVYNYQYTLEESTLQTVRYTITQQSGTPPIYFPKEGYLKVSSKQLVMDSTPNDGPTYSFERD